jgi:hypothetical protein
MQAAYGPWRDMWESDHKEICKKSWSWRNLWETEAHHSMQTPYESLKSNSKLRTTNMDSWCSKVYQVRLFTWITWHVAMKQNTDLSFYWLYKGVPTPMERCYILNGRKLPLKPLYWIVIEYKLVAHWPFLPSTPPCFQVKKEWPSSTRMVHCESMVTLSPLLPPLQRPC